MVTRIVLSSLPSVPSPRSAPPARGRGKISLKKLGRRIEALEFLDLVEIAIIERHRQNGFQRFVRAADIDHDSVDVERFREERRVDDEGRAVQGLGRADTSPRNE